LGGAGAGGSSRGKLTGRAAILLLVVAVLAVSYASSTRAWLRQRGEINELNAGIAAQKAAVQELQQEKKRWHDPAYIKTQARMRFGWVMPGETGYRVIGDDGEVIGSSSTALSDPSESAPVDDPDWWESAWGSVVAAGDDPTSADETEPEKPVDKPVEHIGPGSKQGDKSGKAQNQ
jgi:cell division protein FtsB